MLVSLCITCYNQTAYIEDALESAFAQTYSPLEIVILDDCSTDDTYQKIESLVAAYRSSGGKHSVIAARNERNLGVAKNYDKCFRMAHGELLVTGSGDDVSLPNRCARLAEYYQSFASKPMAIIHNGYRINSQGSRSGTIGRRSADFPLGAATAYNRKLFDFKFTFPEGVYEDHIYAPVADVLGGVVFLDEMLMEYRVGTGLSSQGIRQARIKTARASVSGEPQSLKDIESLRAEISQDLFDEWSKKLTSRLEESRSELDLYAGRSFVVRWRAYRRLRSNASKFLSPIHLQQVLFLFPEPLGDFLLKAYSELRNVIRRRKSLSRL